MTTYQISTHLHSFCKTFEKDLTKPQIGRTKEMIHGIIRGKKALLSTISKQNRRKDGKVLRKQSEQYSNMLSNLPLETMLFRKLKTFGQKIKPDNGCQKENFCQSFHINNLIFVYLNI